MADGRKRSAAKRARREARLRKAHRGRAAQPENLEDTPLIDEVRQALDGGQPIELLGLVSMLILATASQPVVLRQPDAEEPPNLEAIVSAFVEVRAPETTALLTGLGELVDDDLLRARCRDEVGTRTDELPRWLAALAQTTVHRVVKMSHVLGDGDELLLGVRFADGQEMTCAAFVDHLENAEVTDAFFVPNGIDAVVAIAETSNSDPDTSFVDLELTDGRAQMTTALDRHLATYPLVEGSDTWPGGRALVQWLTSLLPTGEPVHESQQDSVRTSDLLDRFFGAPVGAPFADDEHRELLGLCIEEGTGDAVRWSAPRLTRLLDAPVGGDDAVSLDVLLGAPELLRAFVPFAHAEAGIRQELTAEALVAIDEMADAYRAAVLAE